MANISNNHIARAIYLAGEGKNNSELRLVLRNAVKFMARHRLLSKSEEILSKLRKIVNQDRGILEVKVWSKHKISVDVKSELKRILQKRYKNKEIELEENLDEKLLGGIKIEANDELIDLTLKNKIYKLQEHLIKSA